MKSNWDLVERVKYLFPVWKSQDLNVSIPHFRMNVTNLCGELRYLKESVENMSTHSGRLMRIDQHSCSIVCLVTGKQLFCSSSKGST